MALQSQRRICLLHWYGWSVCQFSGYVNVCKNYRVGPEHWKLRWSGIRYGASAMSGHKSGVQVNIREKASAVVYVHCASHCLNLVYHSSQQPTIRNVFTTLSEVINLYDDSPKRSDKLDVNLLTFCETRFIHRHDAIMRFAYNFVVVLSALQDISKDADIDARTRTNAMSLINAILSLSFVVSLAAAKKVMSLTLTLSRRMQSPKLDLSDGSAMAESVIKGLQEWRLHDGAWNGAEFSVCSCGNTCWYCWCAGSKTTCKLYKVSQAVSDETDSDCFKRSIWLPFLDTVIVEMKDRFGNVTNGFLVCICSNVLQRTNGQFQ